MPAAATDLQATLGSCGNTDEGNSLFLSAAVALAADIGCGAPTAVTFGETAANGEMCMGIGYYFPAVAATMGFTNPYCQ